MKHVYKKRSHTERLKRKRETIMQISKWLVWKLLESNFIPVHQSHLSGSCLLAAGTERIWRAGVASLLYQTCT